MVDPFIARDERWLLPEGIEELLPEQAERLEPKVRNNSEATAPAQDLDPTRSKEYLALKEELDQIKQENRDMKTRLKNNDALLGSLEDELDTTKGMLQEKEQDYDCLLKEFSNQSDDVPKLSGLVIHDIISEPVALKLSSNKIDWKKEKLSAEDLRSLTIERISTYDVIVVITGTVDLMEGRGASTVFADLKSAMDCFTQHAVVYCVTIPPNMEKSVQVNLLNHKISQLAADHPSLNLISIPPKGLRSTMLQVDGCSLSEKCINIFSDCINSDITVADIKPKAKSMSSSQFEVKAFLPLRQDKIGRVIGKGGNMIKKITDETNVIMTFGKWTESTGKGREEKDSSQDGALISGLTDNVQKALNLVAEITSRDYEPNEKKRKI